MTTCNNNNNNNNNTTSRFSRLLTSSRNTRLSFQSLVALLPSPNGHPHQRHLLLSALARLLVLLIQTVFCIRLLLIYRTLQFQSLKIFRSTQRRLASSIDPTSQPYEDSSRSHLRFPFTSVRTVYRSDFTRSLVCECIMSVPTACMIPMRVDCADYEPTHLACSPFSAIVPNNHRRRQCRQLRISRHQYTYRLPQT
jgi:hypothetical protein